MTHTVTAKKGTEATVPATAGEVDRVDEILRTLTSAAPDAAENAALLSLDAIEATQRAGADPDASLLFAGAISFRAAANSPGLADHRDEFLNNAVALFTKLLDDSPIASSTLLQRAEVFCGQENYLAAIEDLKQVVRLFPGECRAAVEQLSLVARNTANDPEVTAAIGPISIIHALTHRDFESAFEQAQAPLNDSLSTHAPVDEWNFALARVASYYSNRENDFAETVARLQVAALLNASDDLHHPVSRKITPEMRAEISQQQERGSVARSQLFSAAETAFLHPINSTAANLFKKQKGDL